MGIGERILALRKQHGFSQEALAERLGVSRQAVSCWEQGTAKPDADNLARLSQALGVTADALLRDGCETDGVPAPSAKQPDPRILHMNLTRIAIIAQAAFLNAVIYPWDPPLGVGPDWIELAVKLALLLAASLWMARNLWYERDPDRRRRNARIETMYCAFQAAVVLAGWYSGWRPAATAVLLAAAMVYIFCVNPRYMGRTLVRRKKND